MSSNPLTPSFRRVHRIPKDAAHDTVRQFARDTDQSVTDLNQAIESVKSQIETLKASQPGTSTNTTTSTITNTVTFEDILVGLGTVNDQTGATTYVTQTVDAGTLLILNDASPVAVSLNSVVATPYGLFITNFGAGTATLTPTSGTVNGGASFALLQKQLVWIVFDGTNWKTSALSVPPATIAPVAGEYLTGYDAATGLFSASTTPGISGTITTAALTTLGTQGSMTFVDGILTAQVPAT